MISDAQHHAALGIQHERYRKPKRDFLSKIVSIYGGFYSSLLAGPRECTFCRRL